MIWILSIIVVVLIIDSCQKRADLRSLQNDARRAAELGAQGDKVRYNRVETVGHDLAALTIRVSRLCAFTGQLERSMERCLDLERTVLKNTAAVNQLTPKNILMGLRAKEEWLATANTRIDNAIGTARAAGEAAGENAARNLIRECVERAAQGKGPPLQVLPEHFVSDHIAGKLREGGS